MRTADIKRITGETQIELSLNIDGKGVFEGKTGIGFFDHMLELFARHSMMDISIDVTGDLYVDAHHTVEDVGICIGQAILKALGDKRSINRYGTFYVPMDEALTMVSLDLSGRPYLVFNAELKAPMLGNFETELTRDFFMAVANNSAMTLHINNMYGRNTHHIIESMFKAFGRAMDIACQLDDRVEGVPSTKGIL